MSSHERWNALLAILARDGKVEVDAVAVELGVSAATIRRDLDHLSRQQMLTRTRGGAVAGAISYDLPLQYKAARHAPEKLRIAAAASALVPPGAIVGLNGGTTTTEVARSLASRADLDRRGGEPSVTVVTNALNIANELVVRRHVKIVVIGGVALPASYELIGPLAEGVLREVSLDFAILGVNALDPEGGAFAHHEGEAGINRLMASRAARVVVVADSSKLGVRAFARICPCSAIHTLVTDKDAPADIVQRFRDAGVEVVQA
ncbi:DeoR/GlpR family DNA-binding transcription regulator [Microtetraspora malaysiensis]|uniref:DeoR/GlpR family DNA-binding transcription regulator n=1 Tax=Microtetraspora malaysiensis TaxID=161358 RepID=UPI003D8C04D9